ncbi:MAG: transcriptional repressor [Candidatus Saganbacteria bacterium]|nr:transcriptional repressor [Candidatus Saganbacteria bacterium]
MSELGLQYFKDYLKSRGYRLTRQRRVIVELFLSKAGHLCADEMYRYLRRKYPRIGHATVYRTLNLLKDAELANEVNFIGKRRRYEQKMGQKAHGHLVCEKCGKVIEFKDAALERRQALLCQDHDFDPNEGSLRISGTCLACRKKGK